MKKIICIVVLCLFTVIQSAYAHPPSNIKVMYDKSAKMLKITISHSVTNPESHYIKKVDVLLNKVKVLQHELSEQEGDTSQFVQYSIPDAKVKDVIRVEAHCSSYGKKFKEIRIE